MDELTDEARTMFNQLAKRLEEEEDLAKSFLELQGALQMLITGAETLSSVPVKDPLSLGPSNAAQKELVISIG